MGISRHEAMDFRLIRTCVRVQGNHVGHQDSKMDLDEVDRSCMHVYFMFLCICHEL